jgi:hypothetical protein
MVLICEISNNYTEHSNGKRYYFIYFALVYTLSKFLTTNMLLRISDDSISKLKEMINRNSFDYPLPGGNNLMIRD